MSFRGFQMVDISIPLHRAFNLDPKIQLYVSEKHTVLIHNRYTYIPDEEFKSYSEVKKLKLQCVLSLDETTQLVIDESSQIWLTKDFVQHKKLSDTLFNNPLTFTNIKLAAISSSGRYISLINKGFFGETLFVIDLASYEIVNIHKSLRSVKQIEWCTIDRHFGISQDNYIEIHEIQTGSSQTIKFQDPILNFAFERDRMFVLTSKLELLTLRNTQWVYKRQTNFLQRFLFPQSNNQTSLLQFHESGRSKLFINGMNIYPDTRTEFIRMDGKICYLVMYSAGFLYYCDVRLANPAFKQLQDKSYIDQLKRNGVDMDLLEMKIHAKPESQGVQLNIVRLHKGPEGLHLNSQIQYID